MWLRLRRCTSQAMTQSFLCLTSAVWVKKVRRLDREKFAFKPAAASDLGQVSAEQEGAMLDRQLQTMPAPYMPPWDRLVEGVRNDRGSGRQSAIDALWDSWSWMAEEAHLALLEGNHCLPAGACSHGQR